MKRKLFCFFLAIAILILCVPLGTNALSPAISVLASDLSLSKCTFVENDLHFSASEFDLITGSFTESITVLSLPDTAVGKLYLDDTALQCPSLLTRTELNRLRFCSVSSEVATTKFEFLHKSANNAYLVTCSLAVLDRLNFAPTINICPEDVNCITYSAITGSGYLNADDPEGDDLYFQIVSYPQKGTVTLSGNRYCYTAFSDSTGSDCFGVVAIDCYGNRSEEATVNVEILTKESGLSYADMDGDEAHAAALTLSYNGALSGSVVGGKALFYPDEAITRIEFLAALVSALGYECEHAVEPTFIDSEKIPPFLAGAIACGLEHGLIENCEAFYPNAPITRADAAAMLCAALEWELTPIAGMDPALQCFLMLTSEGILPYENGKMNAKEMLSRRDAVLAICHTLDRI